MNIIYYEISWSVHDILLPQTVWMVQLWLTFVIALVFALNYRPLFLCFTYLVYGPLAVDEALHADVHGEEMPDKALGTSRWEATLDALGS